MGASARNIIAHTKCASKTITIGTQRRGHNFYRPNSSSETSDQEPAKYTPPSLPKAVPVVHSSAFVKKQNMAEDEFNLPDTRRRPPSKPVEYSKDNVVQWALSRVDQSLDEFEEEPNSVAKAAWSVGKASSKAASDPRVQAVAEGTVKAGEATLRAAVPLGKAAAQWGLKAALGVKDKMEEAQKRADASKPKSKKKKTKKRRS
eukprot:gene9006-10672_t